MNYFKNGLKSVLGNSESTEQNDIGAETVDRLVERLSTSTHLEDRRDACRGLKALSSTYQVEVGAHAMLALLSVLELDGSDSEIIGFALETLCNITGDNVNTDSDQSAHIGQQFTEILIKSPKNVTTIMNYIEEYDFRVRWSAMKLLISIMTQRPKDIQNIVLESPMAVSKLMDLLSDEREVIRNDALILIMKLVNGNGNLQKIVAFENAFDRLFDVIHHEGGCSEGGIIVEDCLMLMFTLLKNNASNQAFFKEGSYIQRLSSMFRLDQTHCNTNDMSTDTHSNITQQMSSNLYCMLTVVRSLINPSNSFAIISACQQTMHACGLLDTLCNILTSSSVPVELLTETIITVAEVCRGDNKNQKFLGAFNVPSHPSRPIIVFLLMSLVNEKQPIILRCAVLYCFECYLYKNDMCQSELIQTLLPSNNSSRSKLSSGQLLCGGLFSNDALANWFSAVALMHGVIDNTTQKEQLLRVMLATSSSPGTDSSSLLHQCTIMLQKGIYGSQSKIGVLMLLCSWLYKCPIAVRTFLNIPGMVSFLIAEICGNEHDSREIISQCICALLLGICVHCNDEWQINDSYSRDDLCQLIKKRIGVETFCKKLCEIQNHESYSRASKQPQIIFVSIDELLLDYEFCKLFKCLESTIINQLHGSGTDIHILKGSEGTDLVPKYKEIIREQDGLIKDTKAELEIIKNDNIRILNKLKDLENANKQLTDQNLVLKAQLAAATNMNNFKSDCKAPESDFSNSDENNLIRILRKDQEDLLVLLSEQETQIRGYKTRIKQLNGSLTDDEVDTL